MSYKVLVIGDSFARFDKENSHWAREWISQFGGTTIHMGFGGNNVVNVINEFEHHYNNNEWDFDGVIFQIPDLYRLEGAPVKYEYPEDASVSFAYYDAGLSHPGLIEDILNGNSIINPSITTVTNSYFQHYWFENMQLFFYLAMLDKDSDAYKVFANRKDNRDMNILAAAEKLYTAISPRWLVRANYHALKYFNLLMASHNKPVCFVFNPGIDPKTMGYFSNSFKGLSNIWHMNINSENIGDNHVSLKVARECAKMWYKHNKITRIFPV